MRAIAEMHVAECDLAARHSELAASGLSTTPAGAACNATSSTMSFTPRCTSRTVCPIFRKYPCSTKYIVSTVATPPASASPRRQSQVMVPTISNCSSSNATPCSEKLPTPRIQVRSVRICHLPSTRSSRACSRNSAPNAFTVALQVIASASAAETRVSHALDKFAAGRHPFHRQEIVSAR